jgi:hypothetical protein
VRRQDTAKYAEEKRLLIFPFCYEHYQLSVRQEESAGVERTLLKSSFPSFPSWILGHARGELGK